MTASGPRSTVQGVVTKKSNTVKRTQPLSKHLLSRAMLERVVQRIATRGRIQLPAVPGLLDEYVRLCSEVFAACGRGFSATEREQARRVILETVTNAFRGSSRSKVEITFEAEPARALGFSIEEDSRTIAQAYERWIGNTEGPLFGARPDARVLSAVARVTLPEACPILDFGAGTGRNAFALARLGHPVDAVEITPRFVEMLTETTALETLPVRVIADDVFSNRAALRQDYAFLIASEVVPDFRDGTDLRKLFELAESVLRDGGRLLFNVHVSATGYEPERAARELSQQCYSCVFTPSEIVKAASGLSFELLDNVSVHDFEKEHSPVAGWPPVPWYENWTKGLDVYEIEEARAPIELRWLTFEKRNNAVGSAPGLASSAFRIDSKRGPAFNTGALRKALSRRFLRRLNASGTLVFPALPGLQGTYVAMSEALFRALGRSVSVEQSRELLDRFTCVLTEAFDRSQRSNVVFTYEAPSDKPLKYTLTAEPLELPEAYEQWQVALHEELFGEFPDARLLTLLDREAVEKPGPVLDWGAGLGRNALALAERGYAVDAVEMTSSFVATMAKEAERRRLPLRVFERDVFSGVEGLNRDYRLVIASGLVGDLRSPEQLRQLFELSSSLLAQGGLFVVNIHFVAEHFDADDVDRNWSQHCCSMFYNPFEVALALQDLPFELIAADDAFEFERTHLPQERWPVTPAFVEWATGRHLYAVERKYCPVALKWLVLRKLGGTITRHFSLTSA